MTDRPNRERNAYQGETMMEFVTGMMKLPLTAMTTGMELFTQAAKGVGKMAGGTLGYSGDRESRDSGEKRSTASAKRRVTLGDSGVKLIEYVLVDLAPDHEQIVDRGHRVIRAPTTEDRLSAELIAEYAGSPGGTGRQTTNLRAHVAILDRWSA